MASIAGQTDVQTDRPINDTHCFHQLTQDSSVWTIAAAFVILNRRP